MRFSLDVHINGRIITKKQVFLEWLLCSAHTIYLWIWERKSIDNAK
jgi:hypothetical protein